MNELHRRGKAHSFIRWPVRSFPMALILTAFLLTGCPGIAGFEEACVYNWPVSAFDDANANGIRDPGEPSIENVRLVVDYAAAARRPAGTAVIGTKAAEVNVFPVGFGQCPPSMKLRAMPPRGWEATTPVEAAVTGEPTSGVALGFRWNGGERPSPPRKGEALAYYAPWSDGEASGWVYLPNGELWVAFNGTHGPLRRYRNVEITPFETGNFPRACGIAADQGGALWMGICYGGGVMRFDGVAAWQRYRVADGLLSDDVIHMDSAADGSIWATHYEGYSRLDPQTGRWQALPELIGYRRLTPDAGGALWFLAPDKLLQLRPEAPLTTQRTFAPPALTTGPVNLEHLAVTEDSAWAVTYTANGPALLRYEPAADRWTAYTYDSTGGAFPLDAGFGLTALHDDTLFLHSLTGGYRLLPGPGGDPTAWRMVVYPQLAGPRPIFQDAPDIERLKQLIFVRWGESGTLPTWLGE